MHLAGLHTGPYISQRHTFAVHISSKSMSGFMSDYLHIMLCAVEIGKDKRYFIVRNTGAVAASGLSFRRKYIHQLIIQHSIEKFSGLR